MRSPERKAEIAQDHLLRAYFAGRGFRISKRVIRSNGTVIVRFPEGGPSGLKKLPLSAHAVDQIMRSMVGL